MVIELERVSKMVPEGVDPSIWETLCKREFFWRLEDEARISVAQRWMMIAEQGKLRFCGRFTGVMIKDILAKLNHPVQGQREGLITSFVREMKAAHGIKIVPQTIRPICLDIHASYMNTKDPKRSLSSYKRSPSADLGESRGRTVARPIGRS